MYAIKNGELARAQGVVERIVDFTKNTRPEIARNLGDSFKEQGLHSRAYKFYFKARDEGEIIKCMEHVMQAGYESEQDLFVARACLDMLQRTTDLSKARAIRQHFKNVTGPDGSPSPILSFLEFLFEAVELGEFEMVEQMANQDYKAAVSADPALYEKVNQICLKYFGGRSIKAENPLQAMMSNLLGGGK